MTAPSPIVARAASAIEAQTRLQQDFPVPGVLFRDLSPLFASPSGLRELTDGMIDLAGPAALYAGLEARGFIFASAAAVAAQAGMLVLRKAGKLPGQVIGEQYALEYGSAAIEVNPQDVPAGSEVAILDDVLATGGTAGAAIRLLRRAGASVTAVVVAIELEALGGRASLADTGVPVHSICRY